MMKNVKMLMFALLLGLTTVKAQETTVDNVLNLRSAKHSGQIIENNKLVGYFIFFTKEKVDKANTAYEIEVFDDNYNSSSKFEIVRPKNSLLLEMVYNGFVFMLHFFDQKSGYEFVTFDKTGEMTGSTKIPKDELSNWEIQRVSANLNSNTENVTLYPNGNKGFIRSTFAKYKKLGYEIVAYDNEAKEIWSIKSNEASSMVEMVEINDITSKYMTATVTKKKNVMTREMTNYLLLVDIEEGKVISETKLGDDDSGLRSLLKSFVDEKRNNITIVGEFFKPKDDIVKDRSQGIYLQEISLDGQSGEIRTYAWKGELAEFTASLEDGDKKERPFYIFFHDVIIGKNGSIFLIGEQFLKQVSAGGVAMNILASASPNVSTNASNFEILIGNMLVFEFNAKKDIVNIETITKKRTRVILPQGMGAYGSQTLGYYIKSIGGFDYSFTSRNKEKDMYEVVYIDANRKEDDKSALSDVMIGVISIKQGKTNANRIPINCKSSNWWIQPGKPGFISVSEYFRKEKKINMRLEKLTY